MKEILRKQKEIDVNGEMLSVWSVTNKDNGITYKALKLDDRHLFVPVNGGKSGDHAYNTIAEGNVVVTDDKFKPVEKSAKLMGVLFNGKREDIITRAHPIAGITGIMFKSDDHPEKYEHDIIAEVSLAYPNLKIEPVID